MQARTLQIVQEEHQALAAMLRSMSMLLSHARRHGALPDFDLLRAMLFYIDEFPERLHHPKETQLLFPRLLARAPQLASVIGRLDAEHARGEAAIRELEHAMLAFEVMGPSRRDDFEAAAKRYIDGYLSHMATEEHEILPTARKVFDEADWRELDAAFEANRDPLTGHEPSDEFRALFSRIATVAPAPIGLG
ncbi:MAG: hemerythrin domain-containing protein [Rubrivivax sp.]|nr:hemerythrin domain-containing protein [Rubrivivax sp.]